MQRRYKILITGSSGMLGIDLSRELSKNYELYGVDKVTSHQSPVTSFVECDITDEKSTAEIIANIKPDVVIHTAAMTDVDGCELDREKTFRINIDGTRNIALACKNAGSAMIYISTDFIFDGKKKEPYVEDDEPGPLSVYGDSKLKGEAAVRENLKAYFIIRTSWLYGRHGKNFVDTILTNAKAGKALRVVNDQVGSPTYTKDLAVAIHVLLNRIVKGSGFRVQGSGIYHVSNSGRVSWYEYAKEILRLVGSKTAVIPISSQELDRPARRPAMSVLDNSKFIKFTSYKMQNWKDALKEYINENVKESIC